MDQDTSHILQLRDNVLQELAELSEHLAGDEDMSYDLLLTLARNSGREHLYDLAYKKIQSIEDPKEKSDALLDLLEEIEVRITNQPPQENTESQPSEGSENMVDVEHQHE